MPQRGEWEVELDGMSSDKRHTPVPRTVTTPQLVRELNELQVMADGLRTELDELRESQALLEGSRDDYVEIHDLAPVALMTLSKDGLIRSANLATAELFEQERGALIQRRFNRFIHEHDRASASEYLADRGRVSRRGCEARLVLGGGRVVPVQIWARASWRKPGVQHVTLLGLA